MFSKPQYILISQRLPFQDLPATLAQKAQQDVQKARNALESKVKEAGQQLTADAQRFFWNSFEQEYDQKYT